MASPSRYLPWIISVALVTVGITIPIIGPTSFGLTPTDNAVLSGALGGALIGAAGALFALLVMDWRQQEAAADDRRRRIENAKKLIAAELVNAAMGMMAAKRNMDIAVETGEYGGILPEKENFDREMPRKFDLTDSLAAELLILPGDALDALVTLKSNMERTGEGLSEITSGRRRFGLLAAQQLSAALAHDMGILAECFDHFAPNRKFKIGEKEPELASAVLLRFAKMNTANEKVG